METSVRWILWWCGPVRAAVGPSLPPCPPPPPPPPSPPITLELVHIQLLAVTAWASRYDGATESADAQSKSREYSFNYLTKSEESRVIVGGVGQLIEDRRLILMNGTMPIGETDQRTGQETHRRPLHAVLQQKSAEKAVKHVVGNSTPPWLLFWRDISRQHRRLELLLLLWRLPWRLPTGGT